jgi:cytochrome c-type biogenesis protein
VSGLGAEVGQVDLGHGIGGADAKDSAGREGQQAFAGAQHGERAEEPLAIHHLVPIGHGRGVAGALSTGKVTAVPRGSDAGPGDDSDESRYLGRDMFGIEIIDAALLPAMLIALLAGVLSFLSPCVLPIVPPYLAYMGGISVGDMRDGVDRHRVILPALFFVMGLSTIFLLLGFTASAFGSFVLENQLLLARLSGALIIIFGLHFLGVFRIAILDREMRVNAGDRGGSAFGAYLLGLAFAFGWTPCIGPQLGAILSLAAQEGSMERGTLLLGVYALGLGLPFLLAAIFIEHSIALMARLKRHMKLIERLMGGLLALVGLALVTGAFTDFSYWMLETYQFLGLPLPG